MGRLNLDEISANHQDNAKISSNCNSSNCNVLARGAGFEPARPLLTTGLAGLKNVDFVDYSLIKADFCVWLESQSLSEDYKKQIVSYLERFGKPIMGPMDVAKIFQGLTFGQKKNLNRALRNLFKFYEKQGLANKQWLDILRDNIPTDEVGIDLNIPSDIEVMTSLRKFGQAGGYQSYFAVYNLVLDSGLRLSEAVRFLADFREEQAQRCHGFYVATLGYFRKSKMVYYAFFTEYTMDLIKEARKLKYDSVRGNLRDRLGKDIASWKYLRKFAFDAMTSEQLNIPESVADFIQGRVPRTIGARHYMQLKRKAIQFYPRYAEYVRELRRKAGLTAA